MTYKILVVVLAGILIGLLMWSLVTRDAVTETRVDSGNFQWVKCPSCEQMFYVQKSQRRGWCPYDGFQFDFSAGR